MNVIQAEGKPMAKDEAPDPESGGTSLVRVNADIAGWLGAIHLVTGQTAAQTLDPLIRPAVYIRFKEIESAWREIVKARSRHRKSD